MARSLSQDLRDRVVAAIDDGLSCRAAAGRFGVSVSSAIRWRQLALEHGQADERLCAGHESAPGRKRVFVVQADLPSPIGGVHVFRHSTRPRSAHVLRGPRDRKSTRLNSSHT